MRISASLCLMILWIPSLHVWAQKTPPLPAGPVPTPQQLAWHELEQYAFVHFTTNTFTDKEWGYGDENPQIFNPTAFDAGQWVRTFRDAGLKAVILTSKHHDGFCLWPSKYTGHSVMNSPFRNGKGDVVREVEEACRKYGLKFGVYLSPWDRNHPGYGTSEYLTYYRNQLVELFNNYGPIFEMWFDGANGGDGYYGGVSERRTIDGSTYYEWPITLNLVRRIESDVLFFSDAGPDIRWCGNESGFVNETNWCTITNDTLYAGKSGLEKLLETGNEDGTKWIPAEVDVSIRPGWFYHEHEDEKVKTPEQLFKIYLTSVGRGANLLLNIPPDRRGLLHENDIKSLIEWKKLVDSAFSKNFALGASAIATATRGNSQEYGAANLLDGKKETYWATDDHIFTASIEIELGQQQTVQYILLQEYIKLGQRVKGFTIEAEIQNKWVLIANATTIGYKRIVSIDPLRTRKIRIHITDSKACPLISNIEIY